MPILQERVIAILDDFEEVRERYREVRGHLARISVDCKKGELKSAQEVGQLLDALLTAYPTPASEVFAMERRHFKSVQRRNIKVRERLARVRASTRHLHATAKERYSLDFAKERPQDQDEQYTEAPPLTIDDLLTPEEPEPITSICKYCNQNLTINPNGAICQECYDKYKDGVKT